MPILLDNGATIASPGELTADLIDRDRQIAFNGLLMGSGTPFRWVELTEWDDMPSVDLSDSSRPNDHGDYPGTGLYQARLPMFTIQVRASSTAQMESLLNLLISRMTYEDTESFLVVRDSGKTLYAKARVIGRGVPHTPVRTIGILQVSVQWKCASPLRFALGASRYVRLLPSFSVGGLTYPLTYPLAYGTSGPYAFTMANDGDAPAPVTLSFHGPATSFGVLLDGEKYLGFNLPLAGNEGLEVDTQSGTVLLNASSDRSGWLDPRSVPPETWRIPPGGAPVSFVVDGADAFTYVDLVWGDTYW